MLSYYARYFKAPVFLALRTSSPQPAFLIVLRTALALSLLVPWYAKAIEYAQMQSAWSSIPRAFSSVFEREAAAGGPRREGGGASVPDICFCFGYGDMRMCSVRVESATFCLSFGQIDGAAACSFALVEPRFVLVLAFHWNQSPVVA